MVVVRLGLLLSEWSLPLIPRRQVHENTCRISPDPLIYEAGFLLPSIHAAPPFFT